MKAAPILLFLSLALAGATPPQIGGLDNHPEITPDLAARVLTSELNCTACHQPATPHPLAHPTSLDGRRVARSHRDYLERLHRRSRCENQTGHHHAARCSTATCHEAERKNRRLRHRRLLGLAHLKDGPGPEFTRIDPRRRRPRKRRLYQKGRLCRLPRTWMDPISKAKYSVASLTEFLEGTARRAPQRAHARTPNSTHFEADRPRAPICSAGKWRQTRHRARQRTRTRPSAALLFEKHGCVQCHDPRQRPARLRPAELAGRRPQQTLPVRETSNSAEKQKHSPRRTRWRARDRLRTASNSPSPSLNCIACHTRDGYGGVYRRSATRTSPPRTSTSASRHASRRRSPASGRSSTRSGCARCLLSGESGPALHGHPHAQVRPRQRRTPPASVRGDRLAAARPVPKRVAGPEVASRSPATRWSAPRTSPASPATPWKGETTTTLNGRRAQHSMARTAAGPDWFHSYMRNPQKFHPRPPSCRTSGPAGKAVRPEHARRRPPGKQIDAIWQYLERGREARTPHGIKREPIYYGPGDDGLAPSFSAASTAASANAASASATPAGSTSPSTPPSCASARSGPATSARCPASGAARAPAPSTKAGSRRRPLPAPDPAIAQAPRPRLPVARPPDRTETSRGFISSKDTPYRRRRPPHLPLRRGRSSQVTENVRSTRTAVS